MRRYYLKIGDKSSAVGTVVEGISGCYHHGTLLTFLGAQVYCPACKRTGRIVPKGSRWPDNLMGKNAALDGDLCVCRCNPHPVMLPSLPPRVSCRARHIGAGAWGVRASAGRSSPHENLDQISARVLLTTLKPLSHFPR
ncbi:PAAR domain-containing protein [uncultured Herbaspirillum sp.]|uniref:PAAR domain-containing protein n=1 Tax=uncultured Herbaspirillum sp. TaxID=160236 RepID=UPI0033903981